MEEVLDRKAVKRRTKLVRNENGLYDLKITDYDGVTVETITEVRNITFLRAVSIIEEFMYINGGRE